MAYCIVAVCVMCLLLTVVKNPSFPEQFRKFIKLYDIVIYNTNIVRQIACLVVNPTMVYSYGSSLIA